MACLYFRPDECPVVRINAPEWYQDPQWVAWMNSADSATWHHPGEPANEMSDVFFTYDGASDGSDYTGGDTHIPEHIWRQVVELVEQATGSRGSYCLVWVSNLEE